jgi:hypothetical protein
MNYLKPSDWNVIQIKHRSRLNDISFVMCSLQSIDFKYNREMVNDPPSKQIALQGGER